MLAFRATQVRRPRGNEARRAASRSAPLVRDTTRSQQLFCIHMAKEPPATDEGSVLLVVPYQQRLGARRRLPLRQMRDSECACTLPRIEFRASASATARPRQSRPAGPLADQPSSTRLPELRFGAATAAVAVATPRDPVALSRASLQVASWRAPLGALRWPGRLRSCSRRGLASSSGSQHRDRSAA